MNANFNHRSEFFPLLIRRIRRDLNIALRQVARQDSAEASCLLENRSGLQSKLVECSETLTRPYCRRLVRAEGPSEEAVPRIYRIVAAALSQAAGRLTVADLSAALAPERIHSSLGAALTLRELDAIPIVAKLVFLDQVVQSSEERLRSLIESLQSLERIRWRDVIESISLVERQLRLDPSGVYPRMTFESRSLYRRKVQRLARAQRVSEEQIAKTAIEQARAANDADTNDADSAADSRKSHVGYYLLTPGRHSTPGRHILQSVADYLRPFSEIGYVTAVAGSTALLMFFAWRLLGPFPIWWMALLAIAMVQTSSALVNLAVSLLVEPTELPRLDFSKGIPAHCRTVVAIPTLLLSRDGVAKLIKRLEIHFLANRDRNLRFVLLTDFADSKSSESPNADLLTLCSQGVDRLNAQYAPGRPGPFYLFHRRFRWNESEEVWMGHERKRGKLEDFNRSCSARRDEFETKVGDLDPSRPGPLRHHARYRYAASARHGMRSSSATMAHPLNQAVLDPETKVVVDGYAVLQPRVSISMESAARLAPGRDLQRRHRLRSLRPRRLRRVSGSLRPRHLRRQRNLRSPRLPSVAGRALPGEHSAQPRSDRRRARPRRPGHRRGSDRRLSRHLRILLQAQTPLGARRLAGCSRGCSRVSRRLRAASRTRCR